MTSIDQHTTAVLAVLDAGKPGMFGDGVMPEGAGWQGEPSRGTQHIAYGVLDYVFGNFDGSIDDIDGDADLTWQITAVGANRAAAERVADHAVRILKAGPIVVAGRSVYLVRQADSSGGTRVEDPTKDPKVWLSQPHVTVRSSPA